jgi:hypothetical protein
MLKEVAAYGDDRNAYFIWRNGDAHNFVVISLWLLAETEVVVNEARVQRMRDDGVDIYSIRKQVGHPSQINLNTRFTWFSAILFNGFIT